MKTVKIGGIPVNVIGGDESGDLVDQLHEKEVVKTWLEEQLEKINAEIKALDKKIEKANREDE